MINDLTQYLVFIEISNDNSNEKSQSNHAAKEYKHMNIDSMDLHRRKTWLIVKTNLSMCCKIQRFCCVSLPAQRDE